MPLVELRVEPCHLDLVEDQCIHLSSIQAAFPGAMGLTYKLKDGSKCSLPFDGKSFSSPKEGWSTSDSYTVTLGGFTKGGLNGFFESYQTACKQLERTLHTVLMSQSNNNNDESASNSYHEDKIGALNEKPNVRERYGSFRRRMATLKSSNESNKNRLDLWLPHKNSDEWERQFSELSSILVGKNAIVESQRKQLQTERRANEELEQVNGQLKAEVEDWKKRVQALDKELQLIKGIGTKQEYMGNKIEMLNSELEGIKNTNNQTIEEMQNVLDTVQEDLRILQEQHEHLKKEYERTVAEMEEKDSKLNELQEQIEKLESDLAEHQKQYAEQSKCTYALSERLCKENIGLVEWSKKLELENKERKAAIDKIQQETESRISSLGEELNSKMQIMQEEYEEKCKETINLNNLIESLNKHLTQITMKYNELDDAYNSLRKTSKSLYFRENGRINSPLM